MEERAWLGVRGEMQKATSKLEYPPSKSQPRAQIVIPPPKVGKKNKTTRQKTNPLNLSLLPRVDLIRSPTTSH
eukprot:scaffold8055_cov164-Skeletonema_marinoi.AAC.1